VPFCREHRAAKLARLGQKAPAPEPAPETPQRRSHGGSPRVGQRWWNDEHDAALREYLAAGVPKTEIARRMGFSDTTVRLKAAQLRSKQ
jgi:hypothetical protein